MKTATEITVPSHEIDLSAVRAQGAGGQNVNKVSSAIHLRFDVKASSLDDEVKTRLLAVPDRRITKEGVIIIKAQVHRTQEMNKIDALLRLHQWVNQAAVPLKARRPTKPTKAALRTRMQNKQRNGEKKSLRMRITAE